MKFTLLVAFVVVLMAALVAAFESTLEHPMDLEKRSLDERTDMESTIAEGPMEGWGKRSLEEGATPTCNGCDLG